MRFGLDMTSLLQARSTYTPTLVASGATSPISIATGTTAAHAEAAAQAQAEAELAAALEAQRQAEAALAASAYELEALEPKRPIALYVALGAGALAILGFALWRRRRRSVATAGYRPRRKRR